MKVATEPRWPHGDQKRKGKKDQKAKVSDHQYVSRYSQLIIGAPSAQTLISPTLQAKPSETLKNNKMNS